MEGCGKPPALELTEMPKKLAKIPDDFDVILNVQDEKFYLSKKHLAEHSEFFKNMFYGDDKNKNQEEFTLEGVSKYNFQKFLDVIDGELEIDVFSLEGVLSAAQFLKAPIIVKRCETFL